MVVQCCLYRTGLTPIFTTNVNLRIIICLFILNQLYRVVFVYSLRDRDTFGLKRKSLGANFLLNFVFSTVNIGIGESAAQSGATIHCVHSRYFRRVVVISSFKVLNSNRAD